MSLLPFHICTWTVNEKLLQKKHIFSMSKRTRDKNNNVERVLKRSKKSIDRYGRTQSKNYNELFPYPEIKTDLDAEKSNQISNRCNIKGDECAQKDDIIPLILRMSETISFLTDKLISLSDEIRHIQNNPVLKINNDVVSEEETLLLQKFESFQLPIAERIRLEQLEADLQHDQTFNTFFV